ncbi:oligosaccharide flippase family protein [Thalassotalea nanhaiensis]|uniref:Oligosaccharide flippase family protein n=1 Tax=Thalassotalea nanhaiensis TaxID=3065648 RepID=A0ABY9TN68_9GAMM|nr:oligosaccharide flippase family protein [Colwelliaceae bacterium SQ345]
MQKVRESTATLIALLRDYKKHLTKLVSNSLWLLSSDILGKGSRLITIIVLAATLSPSLYGSAMLALVCHDILRLLLRSGSGNQVINCSDEQLPVIAKNALSLQWIICITLFFMQLLFAQMMASFFEQNVIAKMLTVMAISYLLLPVVSIRVFILQRNNQMAHVGICSGVCLLIENLSIAVLVYKSGDVMAIAYGKLIYSVAWAVIFSFVESKSYGFGFNLSVIKSLVFASTKMMFAESAKGIQQHVDIFMAAKLLSPESFGLYSFAKSAGIGITQSINCAFTNALYPQLCSFNRQNNLQQRSRSIYWLTLLLASLFVVQAAAAFIYMPLFFSEQWLLAIPITSVLCCSACTTIFLDVKCCMFRALYFYKAESCSRVAILLCYVLAIVIIQPDSAMGLALSMLILSTINLFVFIPFKRLYNLPKIEIKRIQ